MASSRLRAVSNSRWRASQHGCAVAGTPTAPLTNMVQALPDREVRIAALERLISVEKPLVDHPRYAFAARRVILQAEREVRRLKGHPERVVRF